MDALIFHKNSFSNQNRTNGSFIFRMMLIKKNTHKKVNSKKQKKVKKSIFNKKKKEKYNIHSQTTFIATNVHYTKLMVPVIGMITKKNMTNSIFCIFLDFK